MKNCRNVDATLWPRAFLLLWILYSWLKNLESVISSVDGNNWCYIQSRLFLSLTGLAFSYYDSRRPRSQLSADQLDQIVMEKPTFLEFLRYAGNSNLWMFWVWSSTISILNLSCDDALQGETRPDTRQDSRGRLGRDSNTKTARVTEISRTDRRTDRHVKV